MPPLVLFGHKWIAASDDVPLYAGPAFCFHLAWSAVLTACLGLYQLHPVCKEDGVYLPFLQGAAASFLGCCACELGLVLAGLRGEVQVAVFAGMRAACGSSCDASRVPTHGSCRRLDA